MTTRSDQTLVGGCAAPQITAPTRMTRIGHVFSTAAGTAALLPLDAASCDGACAMPAVRDRTAGVWRHLTDLRCCQRPTTIRAWSGARQ